MRAHNRGATMINEIRKVVRSKAVIERNQNGANLRNAIEGFEHGVSIGRNVSNAIPFCNAKCEQSRRPSDTAFEELLITQPQFTINNRFTFRVKFARASGKFKWCQWKFHTKVPGHSSAVSMLVERSLDFPSHTIIGFVARAASFSRRWI